MWVLRGGVRTWTGPRPDDPVIESDHPPLMSTRQTWEAVDAIVGALMEDRAHRRATWEQAIGRELCGACGCLCLPDEHCPMCRVRLARRRAA